MLIKTSKTNLFLFIILFTLNANSQITTSNYEQQEEKIFEKTNKYDSISNWTSLEKLSDYKKFIGQKVYLPIQKNKYKYPSKSFGLDGADRKTDNFIPFLFKRNRETIYLDSTNTRTGLTTKFQFRPQNISQEYYSTLTIDSISTNIYNPYFYYGFYDNYYRVSDFKFSNNIIANKYYIITDVIYGNRLKDINFSTEYYYSFENNQKQSKKKTKENQQLSKKIEVIYSELAFELRDEISGEIIYYMEEGNKYWKNRLILTSYFVTQKNKYLGENLYPNGFTETYDLIKIETVEDEEGNLRKQRKRVRIGNENMSETETVWKCIDVTVLENTSQISFILQNKKGETVAVEDLKYWKMEKDIIESEKQLKISKQNLILIAQKEENERILKSKIAFAKRKIDCEKKFGIENGEIIANNKVKIGMTKEMCRISWGIPIWSNKTTISEGTSEKWYYGLEYSLYFVNDKLMKIEE